MSGEKIMINAQADVSAFSRATYAGAASPLAHLGTLEGLDNAVQTAMSRPARNGTVNGVGEAIKVAFSRSPEPGTLNGVAAALYGNHRLDLRA
jgi:hypothetical protein